MVIHERTSSAPPAALFAAAADVLHWPELTASIDAVEALTDGPLRVGSRYRISQPKLRPTVWEVVELVPGESFTTVGHNPGVVTTARHGVRPTETGSVLTLSIEHRGPLAWLIRLTTDKLSLSYLTMEADGAALAAERRAATR